MERGGNRRADRRQQKPACVSLIRLEQPSSSPFAWEDSHAITARRFISAFDLGSMLFDCPRRLQDRFAVRTQIMLSSTDLHEEVEGG